MDTRAEMDQMLEKTVGDLKNVVDKVTDEADVKVRNLYNNQLVVSSQVKEYLNEIGKLEQVTCSFINIIDQVNASLKEVGDIVHWSKQLREETNVIFEGLKRIQEKRH